MGKEQEKSLSDFTCYNCNTKNFFDKANYVKTSDGKILTGMKTGSGVKEVTIECKSCREANVVRIDY